MSLKRKLKKQYQKKHQRRPVKNQPEVVARPIHFGRCPSCGLHVSINVDVETQQPMMLHAMPLCQYYANTNAEAYAREVFGSRSKLN